MSALGNYIHLYYKNYKDYGISRKNKNASMPNYSIEVINNRIKMNTKKISDSSIQQLERRLRVNTSAQIEKDAKEFEKRQFLIDVIYRLLYERSSAVKSISRVKSVSEGGAWFTGTDENGQKYKGQLPLSQQWASSLTHEELMAFSNKANQNYKIAQKIIKQINKKGQATSEEWNNLISAVKEYTHITPNFPQYSESALGAIQEALKQRRYADVIHSIAGQFGEMLVATCGDTIDNLAKTSVQDIIRQIESSVVGAHRTEILFDKSSVSMGNKLFNTSTKDGTQYTLKSSQDKVDVKININEEPMLISVKTSGVQNPTSLHLQSDSTLLAPLVFLNNYPGLENFSNHWLNLHVAHQGMKQNKIDSNLETILKKEIAYQALSTGNPLKKTDSANVFVYINRATGDVHAISTEKLMENFESFSGLKGISKIRFENKKQPQIYQRIQNIISQVHQKKISVSLNASILQF